MNDKFPLLSAISAILRIAGFLLLLPALYYFVYGGIIEPNLPGHGFGQEDLFQLLGGLLGCIIGLGVVAAGEIIGVLFSIEKNTRREH